MFTCLDSAALLILSNNRLACLVLIQSIQTGSQPYSDTSPVSEYSPV